MIENHESMDVFIGLDVGKGDHHAAALDRNGKKLLDQSLPNDEGCLRLILQELESHGRILMVVDQPATIGALPLAVAQASGAAVGYLPGLSMSRIADLHPGEAKMPGTRSSSPKRPGPCRTRCARSRSPRSNRPSSRCCAVSTKT